MKLVFPAGQLVHSCTSEAPGKFSGVVSLPVRALAPAGAVWLGRRGWCRKGWVDLCTLPCMGWMDGSEDLTGRTDPCYVWDLVSQAVLLTSFLVSLIGHFICKFCINSSWLYCSLQNLLWKSTGSGLVALKWKRSVALIPLVKQEQALMIQLLTRIFNVFNTEI